MSNETKKYAGLEALQTFLDGCKTLFATITHKHTLSDISDYTVDSELSSTSTNPVQNKVLDEEFEAISQAMATLEASIDEKVNAEHNHNDLYYTKTEIDEYELITTDDIDTICGSTIQSASEVTF